MNRKAAILSALSLGLIHENSNEGDRNLCILNGINEVYQNMNLKKTKEKNKVIKNLHNEPVRSTSGGVFFKVYSKGGY